MQRYLDSRGLAGPLADLFKPGEPVELLSDGANVFAWADKGSVIRSTRDKGAFHTRGDRVNQLGIALVTTRPGGVNLSGCLLRLRYRSTQAMDPVLIALKPAGTAPAEVGIIPKEIVTRLAATGGREAEIEVPLPATPGLAQVRESTVFSGIAIAERPIAERCCGVWVVNIQSGQVIAFVKFEDALQEIFAVQALPRRRPDILNEDATRLAESFVLPDESLAEVAAPFRRPAREAVP